MGLNPSTADDSSDDPTTRRCIDFARRSGYDSLVLVNIFAWRSTDPRALRAAGPPRSSTALRHRLAALRSSTTVVACWGAVPWALPAARATLRSLLRAHATVHVLGLTRGGHPRHPLYLPRSCRPRPWACRGRVPEPYGLAPRRDTAQSSTSPEPP